MKLSMIGVRVFFQEEIETMPENDLRELQLKRLQALAKHVYTNISFYRDSFNNSDIKPSDITTLDDITKLPFTVKQDLRDGYPFGMFAVPQKDVVRIHASSGTTGNATVVGYTKNDLKNWGDCFGRFIVEAGGSKDSVIQVAYGYGLFTGGLGAHQGGEAVGCTVVPMSSGNTKRQIQFLKDLQTDILCCTPSYALMIAESAIEGGYDPGSDFNISAAILGAEPSSEGMRKEIQDKLQTKVFDIYGLSEIMGPGVACECQEQNGLHVNEDQFLLEIVNPDTLAPVPDGEWGEAVFTTLLKECSPLIRYRTRDITRIIPEKCSCGRSFRRIDRITGRTDDMLIIRGVNVFPSQIEEVITHFDEITAQYQIVLTNEGTLERVEIRVETVPEFPFDEIRRLESLKKAIEVELRSNLQISVSVRIVEPKSIIRSEGKAKRILDMRKGR